MKNMRPFRFQRQNPHENPTPSSSSPPFLTNSLKINANNYLISKSWKSKVNETVSSSKSKIKPPKLCFSLQLALLRTLMSKKRRLYLMIFFLLFCNAKFFIWTFFFTFWTYQIKSGCFIYFVFRKRLLKKIRWKSPLFLLSSTLLMCVRAT